MPKYQEIRLTEVERASIVDKAINRPSTIGSD